MTNIIELAREADPGFEGGPDADGTMGDSLVGITAITRFAALVRAAALEEAARTAEQYCGAWDDEGHALTAAIRARGTK